MVAPHLRCCDLKRLSERVLVLIQYNASNCGRNLVEKRIFARNSAFVDVCWEKRKSIHYYDLQFGGQVITLRFWRQIW